ncbi:MAG: photosynthetic reaction center cytochrome c subunit [Candidatus Viridilinea halotolerans]|uniref:Photosynthetic reaction center cytochrome c subunit n=1 Tax=Candidatus Viridilinea halotolerans TaxID=2491704 RepID=A0A426U9D2_9CHLR|nr:MAG: photosynthetic reaction center cytochrome c subunit [Candidatus Viridilinea halotolerans]
MQSPTRPTDRQAAIFISVAVGFFVAVITIGTFWWIYSLVVSSDAPAVALAEAARQPWSPSDGIKVITEAEPNLVLADDGDPRQPWLGEAAWTEGVQAGQAWIDQFPNTVNVQVLTGMTSAEVWTYMQQYVSGGLGVGCQYCHDINNFALDTYPEKIAARNMLYLVGDLNAQFVVDLPNWQGNYVQCATCHYNEPQNLEGFDSQFIKSVPDIPVVVEVLDENGERVFDPAQRPEELRTPISLQDAVIWYLYNYQVWKPYDAEDPASGRGSLALTYNGGPTQEQVTINQNVMNYNAWSLGQNCTFCHNSRNFVAYELDAASANVTNPLAGYNKMKAQQMLLMTTYIAENWPTYGAIPHEEIPLELRGGASRFSYQTLGDGQLYNVPACYTCHRGANIPQGAINQTSIGDTDAGRVVLPPALRGN